MQWTKKIQTNGNFKIKVNNHGSFLFGPADFGDIIMLSQIVQMAIKILKETKNSEIFFVMNMKPILFQSHKIDTNKTQTKMDTQINIRKYFRLTSTRCLCVFDALFKILSICWEEIWKGRIRSLRRLQKGIYKYYQRLCILK